MVRVSFLVLFSQIASVFGQTSSSAPTEVPSFDSFDYFSGSYDFYPIEDQTSSPSWAPTGSPTEDGKSGRGLDFDDDVSGEDAVPDEDLVSGSGSVGPSILACALSLTPFLF